MAVTLYKPISMAVPSRMCSTPESMDESDVSRSNTPSSQDSCLAVGEQQVVEERGTRREESLSQSPVPDASSSPPSAISLGSSSSHSPQNSNTSSSSLSSSPSLPLLSTNSRTLTSQTTTQTSPSSNPSSQKPMTSRKSNSTTSSSKHASNATFSSSSSSSSVSSCASSNTSPEVQLSSSSSRQSTRVSSSAHSSAYQPLSSGAGGGGAGVLTNTSSSGSLQNAPILLSQSDGASKVTDASNSMLTLGSYVQFMTLKQQSQIGYPALACLPPSVANPPTTLPPQYEPNLPQSYSPSLAGSLQSFGCAAGLIPPQFNQGLIALDMPMSAATASSSSSSPALLPQSKLNMGGFDPNRFMVGGPIPGSLPNHEVARAIGGMGMPLVVAGRNEPGGAGGIVEGSSGEGGNGYKRQRKRTYSQTNQDMQQEGADLHGYGGNIRRSTVFPSEDHCQMNDHSSSGTAATNNNGLSSSTGGTTNGGGGNGGPPQQLIWQAHQVDMWHDLCDGVLQDIPQIGFTVETDKGFVFSVVDDAFVCQKKNHFQVTVSVSFHRTPKFIKIKGGSIQPVDKFILCLHGVKLESAGTSIKLEQSMTDRRRSDFSPVEVSIPANPKESVKHTVCRLHFSETTANNMRKRGKPNPDQKYFSLVVGLNAVCEQGSFPVVAHVSERIIVRASNPGNFDNDCDYLWLKSNTPDSIYHHGRVGINTDKPEEALSVNGNIRVTGCIEHPSDLRIKTDIKPIDSCRQLENLSRVRLYQYRYRNGVTRGADSSRGDDRIQVGVLAQELRNILPDAVHETGTEVVLSDGSTVSKLLVVDKDRLMMETVGAVQGLKNTVDSISRRVGEIERRRPKGCYIELSDVLMFFVGCLVGLMIFSLGRWSCF